MQRIPRLDPDKRVLHLADRTIVVRRTDPREGQTVIRNPPPEVLARILGAVDGETPLEGICARLADEYGADEVVEVLEALDGIVLRLAPPSAPPPALAAVAVVGGTRLALEVARALVAPQAVTVLWTGPRDDVDAIAARVEVVPLAELGARLEAFPVVIAVHGAGTLGEAIDVNRIALAAGVTCIHVVAEPDAVVVGPTVVPYRSGCLECGNIVWYFKQLEGTGASLALRGLQVHGPVDARTRPAVVLALAARLDAELTGLLTGRPYPALLGSMVRVSLGGARVVDFVPTTSCESCWGCNRDGIELGLRAERIPTLPPLERHPAGEGGVGRSIGLAEARRRIEAVFAQLGLEVTSRGYSRKVRQRYPALLELPFVHASTRLTYRPDAPLVVGRVPDQCFGKGATEEQALCSAMFELLERLVLVHRGGVPIVRARHADVREHAIDMAAFTEGVLAVPDRGPRIDFAPDLEIDWVWARCLRTGRPRLVPAHTVLLDLFGREATATLCTFRGSQIEMPLRGSSGLAAGATREDAALQGLYELVEHDARLLHQRSGLAAPAIELASIDDPEARRILGLIEAAGFDAQLRYITHDIKIPVVEAYLRSRKDLTFHRLPGWGVHHDPAIAVRRALTEAVQCLGAAEAVRNQTFARGEFAITNTFHESRYAALRVAGAVRFDELPRPPAGLTSTMDLLDVVVRDITTALPQAELCFFEYPMPGLEGVHVGAVVGTHVINNLSVGHIVQARLRAFGLDELYLGSLKT